ncbi:hypothetical protein D3C80_1193990 [compost metagenome]
MGAPEEAACLGRVRDETELCIRIGKDVQQRAGKNGVVNAGCLIHDDEVVVGMDTTGIVGFVAACQTIFGKTGTRIDRAADARCLNVKALFEDRRHLAMEYLEFLPDTAAQLRLRWSEDRNLNLIVGDQCPPSHNGFCMRLAKSDTTAKRNGALGTESFAKFNLFRGKGRAEDLLRENGNVIAVNVYKCC